MDVGQNFICRVLHVRNADSETHFPVFVKEFNASVVSYLCGKSGSVKLHAKAAKVGGRIYVDIFLDLVAVNGILRRDLGSIGEQSGVADRT